MHRVGTYLLALLLAVLLATPAAAHSFNVMAAVSVSGSEITVRVLDVYGATMPGGKATIALTPQGGKAGAPWPLTEGKPGVYSAVLDNLSPGVYTAKVEVTLGADLFRALLQVPVGSSMPETAVEMVGIDTTPHLPWSSWLFGAAALMVIAATAVAMFRRRPAVDEEE